MSDLALEVTPRIVLRAAALDDLDALDALEREAFGADRAERRAIRHAIRSPSISLIVAALAAGRLVGAATIERRRGARNARLTSLAVASESGGMGIGRTLLAASEAEARSHGFGGLRLEVRADNASAIRLYERAGYRRFAVVEGYYDGGMAAWRYEKGLEAD